MFAYENLVFSILLTFFFSLKLLLLSARKRHMISFILTSFIGLDTVFLFWHRRYTRSVLLTRYNSLIFVLMCVHISNALSAFLSFSVKLNFPPDHSLMVVLHHSLRFSAASQPLYFFELMFFAFSLFALQCFRVTLMTHFLF